MLIVICSVARYNTIMGRLFISGLFIIETVRSIVLAFTLIFLLPNTSAFPWVTFSASAALFPLMALFLWINTNRYKNYIPLYIAGKCIGIFAFLGWALLYRGFTPAEGSSFNVFTDTIFLGCDILVLMIVLKLRKNLKDENEPADTLVKTGQTEEAKCE